MKQFHSLVSALDEQCAKGWAKASDKRAEIIIIPR